MSERVTKLSTLSPRAQGHDKRYSMETFKAAFLSSKQRTTHLLQASLPMGTFEGLPVYLESQGWVESRKEGVILLLSEENGGPQDHHFWLRRPCTAQWHS